MSLGQARSWHGTQVKYALCRQCARWDDFKCKCVVGELQVPSKGQALATYLAVLAPEPLLLESAEIFELT